MHVQTYVQKMECLSRILALQPIFSTRDHRRHQVALACLKLPHPHNAENIKNRVDEVLQEWDIPITKLNIVITDNGSNMLKAFKQVAYVDCGLVNSSRSRVLVGACSGIFFSNNKGREDLTKA